MLFDHPTFSVFKFLRMSLWMGTSGNPHNTHMEGQFPYLVSFFLDFPFLLFLFVIWWHLHFQFSCSTECPYDSEIVEAYQCGQKLSRPPYSYFHFFLYFLLFWCVILPLLHFLFSIFTGCPIGKKIVITPSWFIDEIISMTWLRPGCRYLGCPLTRVLMAHLA